MFKVTCKGKASPNYCKMFVMGSSICSHFQLVSFKEKKHYYCNYIYNNCFVLRWIDHCCVCPLNLGSSIGLDFVMKIKRLRCQCYKEYKIFPTWLCNCKSKLEIIEVEPFQLITSALDNVN
jgi:hypothetical protein